MQAINRVRTSSIWKGQNIGRLMAFCLAVFLICAPAGVAQKKKDPVTRSVSGVVMTDDGKLVVGAVVQLTDTKTKQIRSFYTQEHGDYYFHELSPDIEYELTASFQGASSSKKVLSVYDNRKEATINLKINAKK
jgi:hypothetical protein